MFKRYFNEDGLFFKLIDKVGESLLIIFTKYVELN